MGNITLLARLVRAALFVGSGVAKLIDPNGRVGFGRSAGEGGELAVEVYPCVP